MHIVKTGKTVLKLYIILCVFLSCSSSVLIESKENSSNKNLSKKAPSFKNSNIRKTRMLHLLNISSNFSKSRYGLILLLNKRNNILKIKTKNYKKKKNKQYSVNVLKKGIALVKTGGIKLVTLKCQDFKRHKGCQMTLKYPTNILTLSNKILKISLEKKKKTWSFYYNGRAFQNMKVHGRKIFGKVIGIKKIELI